MLLRFEPEKIRIAGFVPCGKPAPMFEESDGESLAAFFRLNPRATFWYVVRGESMANAGYHDGNVAIVDCDLDPSDGDIVLASINGELTIKRLKLRVTRRVEQFTYQAVEAFVPENPHYPIIYPREFDEVTVYGVVVGGMWKGKRK
jgi:SOS-response transcriptional repressor LexA